MNGKKWRILIEEEYAGQPVKIFDSKDYIKKTYGGTGWERPTRSYQVLIDKCFAEGWIDEDQLFLYPMRKSFSVEGLGRGLQKIGLLMNEPLVQKVVENEVGK